MTQHTATTTGDTSRGAVHLRAVADSPQEAEELLTALTPEEFAATFARLNALPTDTIISLLEHVMETTAVGGFTVTLDDPDTGGSRVFRTERLTIRRRGRDGRKFRVVSEHTPA